MADNVTQVEGATEIEFYLRNYAYADAISDLQPLETILFTDIERVGYKNAAGTLRKLMEDSSGATNIPEGCLLFADGDGRATFDADFKIDGDGYLNLPEFPYGWGFIFTETGIEISKNGEGTGVYLIGE